jgi:hypothetical protein
MENIPKLDLDKICLYHADKQGTMIEYLRAKKNKRKFATPFLSEETLCISDKKAKELADMILALPAADRIKVLTMVKKHTSKNPAGSNQWKKRVNVGGRRRTIRYKQIYTYHTPMGYADNDSLVELWKDNWKEKGFEPIVLEESDAKNHKYYDKIINAKSLYRGTNPKEYEKACYLRWAAMALRGGGLLADYDVWNYTLRIEDLPVYRDNITLFSASACPCLVGGSVVAYEKMLDMFLRFEKKPVDSPHLKGNVSDQNIIDAFVGEFYAIPKLCWAYGEDGWDKAPTVHYATAYMKPHNLLPRSANIPIIR